MLNVTFEKLQHVNNMYSFCFSTFLYRDVEKEEEVVLPNGIRYIFTPKKKCFFFFE